jgi:hypothetical protein
LRYRRGDERYWWLVLNIKILFASETKKVNMLVLHSSGHKSTVHDGEGKNRRTYDLAHEDDILASDEEDASGNVGECRGWWVMDTFVGTREDEVGWIRSSREQRKAQRGKEEEWKGRKVSTGKITQGNKPVQTSAEKTLGDG